MPASDSAAKVGALWAGVLWDKRRWYPDGDPDCIRAAFVSLCADSKRWPSPSAFLEHLPARPPPKFSGLMNPQQGREREPEAFAAMRKQFAELEMTDRLPMHVLESRHHGS